MCLYFCVVPTYFSLNAALGGLLHQQQTSFSPCVCVCVCMNRCVHVCAQGPQPDPGLVCGPPSHFN